MEVKKIILFIAFIFLCKLGNGQWVQLNSGTLEDLETIDFLTIDKGFAGGSGAVNPILLKTDNGGLNWSPIFLNSLYPITSIDYASDSIIYLATGGAEIYKSTNTGLLFTKLTNIIGTSVYFINGLEGFVNQDGSTDINKTDDGGMSWSPISVPIPGGGGHIQKIIFLNDTIGYGIHISGGSPSSVFKTIDGGNSWSVTAQPTVGNLNDISFTSLDTGYIAGDYGGSNGLLMKTVDGGFNWTLIPVTPILTILSMKFTDRDTGYISSGAQIYKSTNGGNNWTLMSGSLNGLFLSFPSDSIGYACGCCGTIIKLDYNSLGEREFNLNKNNFVVFPSPAKTFFTLQGEISKKATFILINSMGQEVVRKSLNESSKTHQIEIQNLPNGVYSWKAISNDDIQANGKIVVIK